MTDQLQRFSQEMIPAVEAEMKAVLSLREQAGDRFFGMMHYHMGWVDASFAPASVNKGKRVRPLLALLICQAAGGTWRQALPAAAALELLHNFTLIHDDIQDSSPTRRGRTTLWKIWGMNQAINSGDAMFALAHIAMSRLLDTGVPASNVVQAVRRLDETCLELTRGQHADMDFEQRSQVTVAEYLAMINGKTAALVLLSAELGALIAGCDDMTIQHYAQFGRDLGLAFQVRDDVLGIWGNESVIGKSAATDIQTRKKSLPVLFGLAQSKDLRRLYDRPENGEGFVDRVIELLDAAGAHALAIDHENRYSESAKSHLAAADPQGSAADALKILMAQLLRRQA